MEETVEAEPDPQGEWLRRCSIQPSMQHLTAEIHHRIRSWQRKQAGIGAVGGGSRIALDGEEVHEEEQLLASVCPCRRVLPCCGGAQGGLALAQRQRRHRRG
uniref:Uncharacterized protein n=1 Tax=Oryza sativa subsp. japonica TaxID=39947 RepID=Q6ZJ92_ORYSJ|nr:hypothetical protein [Oryza sativa Japonica Group]BAD12848.1 hypothetical protein [Oryza sativa Japonica Group]